MINFNNRYKAASHADWAGRDDGNDADVQRWFQCIEIVDLEKDSLPALNGSKGLVIFGFDCDTGVSRNLGRPGAVHGPAALRKACSNLPVHFLANFKLIDCGYISCSDGDLDLSQQELGRAVTAILATGYNLIVWGGGHELMFGHYCGIKNYLSQLAENSQQQAGSSLGRAKTHTLGIINFDAHFDLRKPAASGATSGTGFWQAAESCRDAGVEFKYMALGIQKNSNTRSLFDIAEQLQVDYVEAKYFSAENSLFVETKIAGFLESVDKIYLTICLDVFSAAFAPGVSAPAYTGIMPDSFFFRIYEMIIKSGKLVSTDIAELNPAFDRDHITAKLAASLNFELVETLNK